MKKIILSLAFFAGVCNAQADEVDPTVTDFKNLPGCVYKNEFYSAGSLLRMGEATRVCKKVESPAVYSGFKKDEKDNFSWQKLSNK